MGSCLSCLEARPSSSIQVEQETPNPVLPSDRKSSPQAWVSDDESDICSGCQQTIEPTLFKSGKHHCRACGRVFCNNCSNAKREIKELGFLEPVRVCNGCFQHFQEKEKFFNEYLDVLRQGQVFVKHHQDVIGNFSQINRERRLFLSEDHKNIIWHKLGEDSTKGDFIPLESIEKVVKGRQTQVLERAGKKEKENLYFSIIATFRTLDLEAPSEQIRDLWFDGINQCLTYFNVVSPEEARKREEEQKRKIEEYEQKKNEIKQNGQKKREKLREAISRSNTPQLTQK